MTLATASRVLAVAATGLLVTTSCADDSSGSPGDTTSTTIVDEPSRSTDGAADPGAPYTVGVRSETFVDESRPTGANPNGGFDGAPERTLPTTIWYPAVGGADAEVVEDAEPSDRGPFPVVVFSHGDDAFGYLFEDLLAEWVATGYVVAAPDYPLSNGDTPGGSTLGDVGNQAADASFVLDRLLELDDIADIVDPEHVGAAGHSLGAITTAGIALADCCRDERVDAALLFASPPGFEGGVSFDVPLLVEAGDADALYDVTLGGFQPAAPPAFFVTLLGGEHTEPFRGGTEPIHDVVAATSIDFLDAYLKDDPDAVDALVAHGDVPGVASIEVRR